MPGCRVEGSSPPRYCRILRWRKTKPATFELSELLGIVLAFDGEPGDDAALNGAKELGAVGGGAVVVRVSDHGLKIDLRDRGRLF